MPVVVEVLPEEEFGAWINGQRQAMEGASAAAVAARSRDWSMDELLQRGEKIFLDNCAECHQRDGSGQGSKYPALAASDIVNGPIEGHLDRVMNGKADTEMQAWAPQLSDLDLAAVITYERNSFGNDTGDVVQPMTVYRTR
jgi:cytochrome c oxidase subunit 2